MDITTECGNLKFYFLNFMIKGIPECQDLKADQFSVEFGCKDLTIAKSRINEDGSLSLQVISSEKIYEDNGFNLKNNTNDILPHNGVSISCMDYKNGSIALARRYSGWGYLYPDTVMPESDAGGLGSTRENLLSVAKFMTNEYVDSMGKLGKEMTQAQRNRLNADLHHTLKQKVDPMADGRSFCVDTSILPHGKTLRNEAGGGKYVEISSLFTGHWIIKLHEGQLILENNYSSPGLEEIPIEIRLTVGQPTHEFDLLFKNESHDEDYREQVEQVLFDAYNKNNVEDYLS